MRDWNYLSGLGNACVFFLFRTNFIFVFLSRFCVFRTCPRLLTASDQCDDLFTLEENLFTRLLGVALVFICVEAGMGYGETAS